MFHWFKTLSSGNKIAFILSGGIMTAAIGYSVASSIIAGSSFTAQPIFPNILSSPLPYRSAPSSPSASTSATASTTPASAVQSTPNPTATAQSTQPSQPTFKKSEQMENKSPNDPPDQNNRVKSDIKSMPAGAAALCNDGTYSFSLTRRGACSHHGGIDKWLQDSGSNPD